LELAQVTDQLQQQQVLQIVVVEVVEETLDQAQQMLLEDQE
jgi:hypothetical protein